jgi:hypothetical protein
MESPEVRGYRFATKAVKAGDARVSFILLPWSEV